jgi:aminopeptidase N
MKDKVIDITAYIGRDLKSRIAVREFYDKISNEQRTTVKIDFRNVNFASRSFMDEFYNIFIANADKNVELINLSAEIEAMLDAVKSTQHRAKNSANRISSHHDDIRFSSISEANKYLEALPFS